MSDQDEPYWTPAPDDREREHVRAVEPAPERELVPLAMPSVGMPYDVRMLVEDLIEELKPARAMISTAFFADQASGAEFVRFVIGFEGARGIVIQLPRKIISNGMGVDVRARALAKYIAREARTRHSSAR